MYVKNKYFILFCICMLLFLFETGCGLQKEVLLEHSGYELEVISEDQTIEGSSFSAKSEEEFVIDGQITTTDGQKDSDTIRADSSSEQIYIYICGQVQTPGVYQVDVDARVFTVIQLAGGLTEAADEAGVNQAQTLVDGQMIYIPAVGEAVDAAVISGTDTSKEMSDNSGKVNINTADLETLMSLTGIGESKAQSILNYRQEHGSFQSIEELMNVEGIKEGTYSKIKNQITI